MPHALSFTPAWSRTSASRTPAHFTSWTRQPVTHWKSLVMRVGGRARRSSRVRVAGESTNPPTASSTATEITMRLMARSAPRWGYTDSHSADTRRRLAPWSLGTGRLARS